MFGQLEKEFICFICAKTTRWPLGWMMFPEEKKCFCKKCTKKLIKERTLSEPTTLCEKDQAVAKVKMDEFVFGDE